MSIRRSATFALAVLLTGPLLGCSVTNGPSNIVVSVEAPLRVKAGADFEIKARVKNTAASTQTLVSIDISEKYLNGIAIQRTDPPFLEASQIPIVNTTSYRYDLKLQSQEEKVITLVASALKKGDHVGEADFCINTDYSFLTHPIRTFVE